MLREISSYRLLHISIKSNSILVADFSTYVVECRMQVYCVVVSPIYVAILSLQTFISAKTALAGNINLFNYFTRTLAKIKRSH